jgi:hypothetical protein
MNPDEVNPDEALDIIYDDKLRVVFGQTSNETIEFVKNNLKNHTDVAQIFFDFYKYSHLIDSRHIKMRIMTQAPNNTQQFQKLLDHNERCIVGASRAFVNAMNDYKKYQQGSSASDFNLSWFDRHNPFGSHAQHVKMSKNVKNVTGVYLFMVAFTFALLQYEIMFNARCKTTKPPIIPETITMEDNDFYDVFVNGIGEWLKGKHSLGESADDPIQIIPTFMAEIGTDRLLDTQFADQGQRQSQNPMDRPMSGGRRGRGHGHGSKRPNKRAHTRARRMRRTNKRRSSF